MGRFDGYIIGSDFDGTLCIGGKVSERNLEAIRYFRGEGGHFGVVTGRNYGSTYPYVTHFVTDCYDFTVGLNGAFRRHFPDGEFFFEEHGDIHNVIPLYEYLRSCEDAVWDGLCRWKGVLLSRRGRGQNPAAVAYRRGHIQSGQRAVRKRRGGADDMRQIRERFALTSTRFRTAVPSIFPRQGSQRRREYSARRSISASARKIYSQSATITTTST